MSDTRSEFNKCLVSVAFFLTPHRLVPCALVLADYLPFYTTVPPLPALLPLLRMPHLVHWINTCSPYKYQFKHYSLCEESLFNLWQAHLVSLLRPHRYLVHVFIVIGLFTSTRLRAPQTQAKLLLHLWFPQVSAYYLTHNISVEYEWIK